MKRDKSDKEPGLQLYARSVEVVLAVARLRSFSAAGRLLGISQSCVSQAVRHLEDELGVSFFDREQRPLSLTAEGELLVGQLVHDSEALGALLAAVRSDSGVRPVLTIGLIESVAAFAGTMLAKSLRGRVRELRLFSGNSNRLLEDLANHDIDVAVLSVQAPRGEGLRWRLLYEEPWLVLYPADAPELPGRLTWLQLQRSGLPLLHHGQYTANSRLLDAFFEEIGCKFAHTCRIDSNILSCRFVEEGLGWTVTQGSAAAFIRDPAKVVFRRPPTVIPRRRVYLVSRQGMPEWLMGALFESLQAVVGEQIGSTLVSLVPWIGREFAFPHWNG